MTDEQRIRIENAMRRDEKLLIRWLTARLGDGDVAQDVAQSVFLRVWAYAETADVENPRALIFKTAGNLALNEIKRRNRFNRRHLTPPKFAEEDPIDLVASSAPSPERQTSLREDVKQMLEAINSLPNRPRRAFIMNRFDGYSYKEIASRLGVSESSVEKYMIAALKRLREVLANQERENVKVVEFSAAAKKPLK